MAAIRHQPGNNVISSWQNVTLSNSWYWNLVDVATQHVPNVAAKKASTCLPPTSVPCLIFHTWRKAHCRAVPPLLFPLSISMCVCWCVRVCVCQPHLTSQSNSRCSCPSIHSSISSLLCRSFLLYLTVSLPSFRCAGSSALSTVWNITLDWVPGSDAIAATASGVFTHARTHARRKSHRPGHVCFAASCSVSGLPVCCCSHVCLLLSSVRAAPLSLSRCLWFFPCLSLFISLPHSSFSCNTHWLHYQENGNEICLCVVCSVC